MGDNKLNIGKIVNSEHEIDYNKILNEKRNKGIWGWFRNK